MAINAQPTALAHLISTGTLSSVWLEQLFTLAEVLLQDPHQLGKSLVNKVVATLFFQPSTRTRLGFERACLALGGQIIGCEGIASTRAAEATAESIGDTIRVVSELCDLIVVRHFMSGAGQLAAQASTVPVINAGDGSNEHPTQAISDVWMMQHKLGELRAMTIGVVGDPGTRVLRSLVTILSRLRVRKILFLIPATIPIGDIGEYAVNISLPPDIADLLHRDETSYDFCSDVKQMLLVCDAMEMMPVSVLTLEAKPQQMIRANHKTAERFVVTKQKILATQSRCLLLHPGPRGDELNPDTDDLPNSLFFEQVRWGRLMKMAILHLLIHKVPM